MGVHVSIVAPPSLLPASEHVEWATAMGKRTGAAVQVSSDVSEGVRGADAVYTDVWVSMGEEEKGAGRIATLSPYQVTEALMEKTGNKDSIFLHCLPAVREKEVTSDVIEGPRSRVWEEAENRKHTIKALMLATL
jgi:ornithine carbamoyltransferase